VEAFLNDIVSGKAARRKQLGQRAVSYVRGGRGAAARTVGLLGAIFGYAVRKKLRADNPVRGVIRPADGRRHRRLRPDEYAKLATGINRPGAWPHAVNAARFLAITGWRSGEVIGLKWEEVDLVARTARLANTKTGPSLRPLSRAAVGILSAQAETAAETNADKLVFPASRGIGLMSGFPRFFKKFVKAGGLTDDATPHVLRHSFASVAADQGFSDPTIAALIGHKGGGVTRRYIHSADAVLLEAADRVADEITRMMSGRIAEHECAPLVHGYTVESRA
jgi:integrase